MIQPIIGSVSEVGFLPQHISSRVQNGYDIDLVVLDVVNNSVRTFEYFSYLFEIVFRNFSP